MVVHTFNYSEDRGRQTELAYKLETSLIYVVRPCLKNQNNNKDATSDVDTKL